MIKKPVAQSTRRIRESETKELKSRAPLHYSLQDSGVLKLSGLGFVDLCLSFWDLMAGALWKYILKINRLDLGWKKTSKQAARCRSPGASANSKNNTRIRAVMN